MIYHPLTQHQFFGSTPLFIHLWQEEVVWKWSTCTSINIKVNDNDDDHSDERIHPLQSVFIVIWWRLVEYHWNTAIFNSTLSLPRSYWKFSFLSAIQFFWCQFREFGIWSTYYSLIEIIFYSHYLSAGYCINIERRNTVLVRCGIKSVRQFTTVIPLDIIMYIIFLRMNEFYPAVMVLSALSWLLWKILWVLI